MGRLTVASVTMGGKTARLDAESSCCGGGGDAVEVIVVVMDLVGEDPVLRTIVSQIRNGAREFGCDR